MTVTELKALFSRSNRRCPQIGDDHFGIIAAPDLEGRLYTVWHGEILSRVNPDAIKGFSDRKNYLNPGGDGLWAAPEGSCFGYHYAGTSWSVPGGLLRARFEMEDVGRDHLKISAEVPLINASGNGLFTVFSREIKICAENTIEITDSIQYIGSRTWRNDTISLAAWSLSQFDWRHGDFCAFDKTNLRDLYAASDAFRHDGCCKPADSMRYQVAAGADCEGITLHLPQRGLCIRRCVRDTVGGQYIDIADVSPETRPAADGVKFSFYSDPGGFMEIEAAGRGVHELHPGDTVTLIHTDTIK